MKLFENKLPSGLQVRLGISTYQQWGCVTVRQVQGGPAWQVAPGHQQMSASKTKDNSNITSNVNSHQWYNNLGPNANTVTMLKMQ